MTGEQEAPTPVRWSMPVQNALPLPDVFLPERTLPAQLPEATTEARANDVQVTGPARPAG
jgi:hypothetical protein